MTGRTLVLALTMAALLLIGGARGVSAQTTTPATRPQTKAVVIVLEGPIDEYNRATLFQRFDEAKRLGADTVILQINTYGGLVTAGLDISRFLKRQDDLHVVAFVDEKAISAGAMIALACDEIVMQPGSQIGDCAPIAINSSGSGYETMGTAERAKAESPILADFYESAVRNGYDPLLVQSMVSVGRVVHWVQDTSGNKRFVDAADYAKLTGEGWTVVPGIHNPVDASDTLLTLPAGDALRVGIARAIEPTAASLAQSRQLQVLGTLAPSAGEAIVAFFASTAVRALLTTIFLWTLYTSFSHPGHGMAEVVAMTSLGLLVGVPLLTGYAQWWEILAVLVGVALIALEIFVIPGFGVAGISGIILVLTGLTMTWVGKEPIELPGVLPRLQGTWTALKQGVIVVVTGMACSLFLWIWLQRYLPKLPYFNRLILTTPTGEVAAVDPAAVTVVAWPTLGTRGQAVTDLRPGGSAAFHDETIGDARVTDVISDTGFVRAGTPLVVREVQGTRVVVRAVT